MPKKRNSQPITPEQLIVSSPPDNEISDMQSNVSNSPTPVATFNPIPSAPAKLLDVDKMALDLAKEKRTTALAEAKTALAKSETAELNFKYVVLQIYMKYGLTDRDALSEDGTIILNGAVAKPAGQ